MVHCREIGDRTLVGIQAVILDGAIVGSDCLIGANALVKAGAVIPDGSMVVGSPGKVIRQTDENMRAFLLAGATMYVQKAANMQSDLREVKR
jgi:carbonic anhydrase/acetyltransferase-like protein (isoleucine patch superfamily)